MQGKLCIPRDQQVSAKLVIAGTATPSADADELDATKKKLPKADVRLAVKAWWDGAVKDDERTLLIEFDAGQAGADADFFSMPSESFDVSPESGSDGLRRCKSSHQKNGDEV